MFLTFRELSGLGWSPDGVWVYAGRLAVPQRVVRISLADGHIEDVTQLPFKESIAELSPDAKRFACVVPEIKSDVWLVENFDPDVK